ncbi:Unknown protein, partial [Striga hermonthica]
QQPPPQLLPPLQQHVSGRDPITHYVLDFRNMHPSVFTVVEGPEDVVEWLQQLESIFDLIFTTDEVKIRCATFQKTGDARTWWSDYWRFRPCAERDALTWDQMVAIVKDRYFPEAYRAEMLREFWELKQDVYEHDFTRMSVFSPMLINTDERKAVHFRDGLRRDLCYTLTGHG